MLLLKRRTPVAARTSEIDDWCGRRRIADGVPFITTTINDDFVGWVQNLKRVLRVAASIVTELPQAIGAPATEEIEPPV